MVQRVLIFVDYPLFKVVHFSDSQEGIIFIVASLCKQCLNLLLILCDFFWSRRLNFDWSHKRGNFFLSFVISFLLSEHSLESEVDTFLLVEDVALAYFSSLVVMFSIHSRLSDELV